MMKIKLKWKWIIFASIILSLFVVFALPYMNDYLTKITGETISPDTSFIYSRKDLYDMANIYGESGRQAYIKIRWTLDVIWPVLYTLVLILWTKKLSEYIFVNKSSKILFVLPLSAVALDFLENIGATIVMFRYPLKSGIIAILTPIMTFLKWIALLATIIMLIIFIILIVLKKIKRIRL